MTSEVRSQHLVGPDELRAELARPTPPLVLDVRWELPGSRREEFLEGHIPGSVFVDLELELSDPSVPPEHGGRHPLPTADAFAAAARGWGLTAGRDVVAVDAFNAVPAARLWWLLRYFGHDQVRVLDGGWPAWTASGYAIETGEPAPSDGSDGPLFVAQPGHLPTIDTDHITQWLTTGALLDARAAERFHGEVEPVDPIAGHIPGAVNLPATDLIQDDGRFVDEAHLRSLLHQAGVSEDRPVAASCGSGVAASQGVLALALIDIDATLFPGSYSLWCRTPNRPIEPSRSKTS